MTKENEEKSFFDKESNANFNKNAKEERKEAKEARKYAVGLLTPRLIQKHIKNRQDLVLQYGKSATVTYTLQDLLAFAKKIEESKAKFVPKIKGVPLLTLEKSSTEIDKERSKSVRSATLYQVKGSLFSFRVSGNSKAFYQVRVNFEEWQEALSDSSLTYAAKARQVVAGRISFDCQCGRHQFWYRYLACVGGFAVEPPKEQDFPKIRNPGLTGCCCKHVLKVLKVLKSTYVQRFMQKELEKASKNIGFADQKSRLLSDKDLKELSKARGTVRTTSEATQAHKRFLQEASAFLKMSKKDSKVQKEMAKLIPKKAKSADKDKLKLQKQAQKDLSKTSPISKTTRNNIIERIKGINGMMAQLRKTYKDFDADNAQLNTQYNSTAKEYGISREQLDTLIKEEKL